ncbi:GNAT family N-acetyltransferase [Spirulina major]|uniref:GNAT family N-acetyltransferase n=1 Tax=Spirulina major TaxID=270636 RepID=UPI000933C2FB|nr:GNAT family N-acetyltransferase [Spirulina major]
MLIAHTPRLCLRRFCPEDLDPLALILSDPEVMYFSRTRQPLSRAEAADLIHHQSRPNHPHGLYAVTAQASGELLGYCGLIHQQIDGHTEIEIGYRLGRSHWGQGFATEAACAVRDHAARLGIPRVISLIEAANERSRRVAEKVGMQWQREIVIDAIVVQVYGMDLVQEGTRG